VALLVVASALAGAKLQDIVKHVLGRGRARHPVDASGPTRARSRDHDAPAPPRGSVDGARGIDAPSPALSPVRTITRKSIGSPQGVPPRARELALDAVVCARCDACPPLGSSPRSRAASLAAAAGVPARKPDPYLAVGRERYLSWDDYFMSVAFLSAQRSKDPNKQVGAVIVGPERVICGVGYNGFPRGCSDSDLPWAKKSARGDPMETKYAYVCHAEVRASDGASVAGVVARVVVVVVAGVRTDARFLPFSPSRSRADERHHEQKQSKFGGCDAVRDDVSVQRVREAGDPIRHSRGGVL
jgi:dCMP deaminase